MASEVVTQTVAEAGEQEDAVTEALVDQAFQPTAPMSLASKPAAYSAGTTYAAGALVEDPGYGYFRSQQATNKAHTPHTDTDFEWWAPVALTFYPLQSAGYNKTPAITVSRSEP